MSLTPERELSVEVLIALRHHALDFGGFVAGERLGEDECVKAIEPLIAQALTRARDAERERCIEVVQDHSCRTYKECCDCQGLIVKELRTPATPETP